MDQSVGAAHSGGSCQISLSYDKGLTWVVVQSWQGNCPRVSMPGTIDNHYDLNQNYTFNLPSSFPSGDRVIVAWSWLNASGNREFYMSCSCVTIRGNSTATTTTPSGPPLLIANLPAQPPSSPAEYPIEDPIWQVCHTLDDTSIEYPSRYQGVNPVIQAPVALSLQPFLGGNNTTCGSDNPDTVSALGRFVSWPVSSSSSSLLSAVADSSSPVVTAPLAVEQTLARRQTTEGSTTTIITGEIEDGWLLISVPYTPETTTSVPSAPSAVPSEQSPDQAGTDSTNTDSTNPNPATDPSTNAPCPTTNPSTTNGPNPTTNPTTSSPTDLPFNPTIDPTPVTNSSNAESVIQSYLSAWTGPSSNGPYIFTAPLINGSNWTFTGTPSAPMRNSTPTSSPQSSEASSSFATATTVSIAVTSAVLATSLMLGDYGQGNPSENVDGQ